MSEVTTDNILESAQKELNELLGETTQQFTHLYSYLLSLKQDSVEIYNYAHNIDSVLYQVIQKLNILESEFNEVKSAVIGNVDEEVEDVDTTNSDDKLRGAE